MRTGTRTAGPIERRELLAMIAAAVAVNLVGALGVPFTDPGGAWFATLALPAFYPPNWAFGVVWPILYALMGVAAVLVYREGRARDAARPLNGGGLLPANRPTRVALGLFAVQLVVNVAWSPVFWGLQRPDLGLGVLLALLPLVVATIVAFDRLDRRAAVCLVPYLAWVLFATVLNYGIWSVTDPCLLRSV
ncbi:TspO/MBR family protein [Halorubrum vacuolatum]|uniref:TspO and MBR related proteins n=1 Tax=Halorubrum vacuolatum TaxID=63740 RepID=A0A238WVG2_HALVU|nr:TspO/MBR family protein [Halorubrum vacuolatum]SNR50510.1 TspO and MBR related proteins [Halorubrum vacuolatum]